MHFLSDAYRLRAAIMAERAEERAKAVAASPAPAPHAAITRAPSDPVAAKRPAFSFGSILRFPRNLHTTKVR